MTTLLRHILSTTASDLGTSLGVALIGSIAVATYRSGIDGALPAGLPPEASIAARETLDRAVAAVGDLPAGAAVMGPARAAFANGLNVAAIIAAVIAAVAATLAASRLRHIPPTDAALPGAEKSVSEADAI